MGSCKANHRVNYSPKNKHKVYVSVADPWVFIILIFLNVALTVDAVVLPNANESPALKLIASDASLNGNKSAFAAPGMYRPVVVAIFK